MSNVTKASHFNPKTMLALLILTLMGFGALYLLEQNQPQPENKPPKVRGTKVITTTSYQSNEKLFTFSQGVALPSESLEIKSRISSQITYLSHHLVQGGRVTKGDVLVKFDDSELKITLAQKQSAVAQAQLRLSRAEAESQANRRALKDLGRENASDLALGIFQLNQAKADLTSAQASLERAQFELSQTELRAEFSGIIESESVSLGEFINRGQTLYSLFSNNSMEVRLAFSPRELRRVGVPLSFYQDSGSSSYNVRLTSDISGQPLSWNAKLVRTEGFIDEQTLSIHATAIVTNNSTLATPLLKGMFVNATLFGDDVENVSVISQQALRNNGQVWTVTKDNQLNIVDVEVLQTANDNVIVRNLPNQSTVVTSALSAPTQGLNVAIVSQSPNTPTDLATKMAAKKGKKRQQEAVNNEG